MNTETPLQRFLKAQENSYDQALSEIRQGRKRSHWMWYIFPQINGLGFSETSKFYAIKDLEEARDYLEHPVLGARLITISSALLQLEQNNATQVMGAPDDLKLRSSMTLFAEISGSSPVFQKVLNKFFNGEKDQKTINLIRKTSI